MSAAVRRLLRGTSWAAALLSCLLVWVAGTLAAAAVATEPVLFLGAGSLAAVGAWLLACRLLRVRGRRPTAVAVRLAGPLTVAGLVAAVLVPLGDPIREPAPAPGAGTWELDDGTRLAYGVVRAAEERAAPVVLLHGGPGVPDAAGLIEAFAPLADDGRDVWAYDQVGAGRSDRLADPSGYTPARAVHDLDQVRRRIGAQRLVLVGHSSGAHLAAAYVAAHPERVERAVFLSPGGLADRGLGGRPQDRLTGAERREAYALLAAPRALLAYALVQVRPAAAHALLGDAEADARQDRVHAAIRPALHCPGDPGPALHGLGFYANAVPQAWGSPPAPDLRAALRGSDVPALVVKGQCDYLDWASASGYLEVFDDARLVYLRGAGHDLHVDAPDRVAEAVRAFLVGRPVPGLRDRPAEAPADYQRP